MKTSLVAAAALALAAALPATHAQELPKGTPPVEEMARYSGPDRQARLLAAAKAEGGELSVYHVYPALTRITQAFTAKYGIPVKPWRASSETVLQRLVSEARGNRHEADVVQNNAPENEAACREKLLMEMRSPAQANIIPQAVPPHGCWVGFAIDIFIAAYNTTKVRKDELPRTYEELLDPKWKGRLGIEAEDHHWFAELSAALGEQRTHKLFRDLVAGNGLSVRKGHSLLANLVASGEIPLALTTYSWTPEQLKQKAAPIELHPLEPLIAQFSTVAVVKRAKKPYAAMLFYDFVLDEGQKLLHDLKFIPTSRDIEVPITKLPIRYIDPGQTLDLYDKWFRDYQTIVVKPQAK